MDNDNKKELNEELAFVTGGSGGFPDGELPEGFNLCLRCGSKTALVLVDEQIVESTGNPTIDSTYTDKTHRRYHCNDCGFEFWRYGNFWERI